MVVSESARSLSSAFVHQALLLTYSFKQSAQSLTLAFHTLFRIVRTKYGHKQSVFGRHTFFFGAYRTTNPPASAVTIRTVSPIPNDPDFVLRYPNR